MAISQISYSNTFAHWLISTNQVIDDANNLKSNNYTKELGTLYLNSANTALYVGNNSVFSGDVNINGRLLNYTPSYFYDTLNIVSNTSIIASGSIQSNTLISAANLISNTIISGISNFTDTTIKNLTVNTAIVNGNAAFRSSNVKIRNSISGNEYLVTTSYELDGANTFLQANDGITLASAKSYTNNANTFLQANDGITLASAKTYTDNANTFLQANDGITLASAKSYTDSVVSSNNTTLKSYTDSVVSSNNTTLKSYTDSVVSSNNSSLRANDGITLASAKSYTDSVVSSNNTTLTAAYKSYTDSIVSSNNTTLKSYTDSVVSSNNVTLKAYTDSVISSNNSSLRANDGITLASAKSYADSIASSNNVTLKAYTDSVVSSNNVTLKAYTDSVVSSNNTSLRANDGITLASAKSYADSTFLLKANGSATGTTTFSTITADTITVDTINVTQSIVNYGTTITDTNEFVFLANTGTSSSANSKITVNRGVSTNAEIRWYNTGKFWQLNDVDSNIFYRITSQKELDSANTFLKSYTDSLVSSNNTSLKTYTDSVVSSNNSSLRANDGITLASAKSYTDSVVGSNNTTLKAYTDSVVSSNNTSLTTSYKSYTDSVVSSNNTSLTTSYKSYTDSVVSSNNTTLKAYTDSLVSSNNTTLKAYTDSVVSSNNTTLKAYTDSVVSSNNTTLKAYTDSLVSSNNTTLKAYTDSVVSSNNITLKAYTDSLVSSNNTSLRANDGITLASAKSYTDSVVSSNNTSLTTSYKSYTDSVVSSNNTSLTTSYKSYTDSVVSSNNVTLKAYTDSVVSSNNSSLRANDGITLASAKAYTDSKNTFSTPVTVSSDLSVTGNLYIAGITTTLNSTTISINDKNIELANVASPTNTTADGGGITIKGSTDKTFTWVNSTGAWTSSDHLNLTTGKAYYIGGQQFLSSTAIGNVDGSALYNLNAANLAFGLVATARLGTGTANSTTFLRGDSTWGTITSGATLVVDNSTNFEYQIGLANTTSGAWLTSYVANTKLSFNPSTGTVTSRINKLTAPQGTAPLQVSSNTSVANLHSELALNISKASSANQIPFQVSSGNTQFVPVPTANTSYLKWDNTGFSWATVAISGGTVTSVAALTLGTTGTDVSSTVANGTTTPVITLNIPTANATNRGVLSSADWSTFNNKQATLGTANATISGILSSADWSTFNAKTNNTGTVTSVAALTLGTTGTDVSSTVANGTTTPVITLNIPTANATNRGVLSSADWSTFNNKANAVAAEFVAGTALLFYQATAPTGWTKSVTNNDKALRVVSGATGGSAGGSVAFSSAFASKTPAGTVSVAVSAGTLSVGIGTLAGSAVTLTTAQIPSHTHTFYEILSPSVSGAAAGNSYENYLQNTGATGGGGSHTHSITGSPSLTGSPSITSATFTGTAINLAVQYCDVIIATKN